MTAKKPPEGATKNLSVVSLLAVTNFYNLQEDPQNYENEPSLVQ